ncbi:MAG: hypothetical protein AMS18_01330 [Gemmatimonas sp. SG8_17]|nr:MAG: hypothetical protein AMS18_01330 [Gemmatimonas sp. SG8_17]
MKGRDPKLTALLFNECINARDLGGSELDRATVVPRLGRFSEQGRPGRTALSCSHSPSRYSS